MNTAAFLLSLFGLLSAYGLHVKWDLATDFYHTNMALRFAMVLLALALWVLMVLSFSLGRGA